MSAHVPGFQSFSVFFHHFVLAILATRSIRVKILVGHLRVKQTFSVQFKEDRCSAERFNYQTFGSKVAGDSKLLYPLSFIFKHIRLQISKK